MEYGIVYLLTNPVMPGLVKIGMTTQEDIERRMRELYTTGVPVPFECQFACKVQKTDSVIGHDANYQRIWKLEEMDADHVTAWSKGGSTDIENCQM